MIQFEKSETLLPKDMNKIVKLKETGDVLTITSSTGAAFEQQYVRMLDKNSYIVLATGEIREVSHHINNRTEQIKNLQRTFRCLKDLINTNVTKDNFKNVLFLTFTWREYIGMDKERIKKDWKNFWYRFKNWLKRKELPIPECISVIEPTAKGNAHIHAIIIFPCTPPFLPNDEVSKVWNNGFTKTKAIKECSNIGNYFVSYLTDMEYSEVENDLTPEDIQSIKTVEVDGKKKSILKGYRLRYYPPNFKIYRVTQGIKRPTVTKLPYCMALDEVRGMNKVTEYTYRLTDTDTGYSTMFDVELYED